MNRIKVLDCTLRDGGYVNQWEFGNKNIKDIVCKLTEANIDIVECGYITNKVDYDPNCSRFDTIQRLSHALPKQRGNTEYVCMINFGEYNLDDIPNHDGTSVDGIRVAFHKKDLDEALIFCQGIKDKGYKLFIQPMVSVSYSDKEFIDLIARANEINPYAFYIVDSFGVMKRNDLMRLFHLVDNNLENDIHVGYHSHNNLQLAYSNAQALVDLRTKRKLIIDSSVFGMGRGAGNLNTELFIEHLNDIFNKNYKVKPILQIIDNVLNNIYLSNYWGYSLPHYLSAKHNCHPNYASHLVFKETLKVEDISNILMMLDIDKKNVFDKDYIEKLYRHYQSNKIEDNKVKYLLREKIEGKQVLVIAPGRSITTEVENINKLVSSSNTITISVNFIPENINVDYVFVSNIKRYEQLKNKASEKLIVTSNIKTYEQVLAVNYIDLLNETPIVSDNAGLMCLKLLIELGAKNILLAGFDGYSYNAYKNYISKDMTYVKKFYIVDELNETMRKVLSDFSKQANLQFITESKYQRPGDK